MGERKKAKQVIANSQQYNKQTDVKPPNTCHIATLGTTTVTHYYDDHTVSRSEFRDNYPVFLESVFIHDSFVHSKSSRSNLDPFLIGLTSDAQPS